MEFSNLSEYVQEYELRNRIGGCFSGNSSRMDNRNRRTYCDYCVQQICKHASGNFYGRCKRSGLTGMLDGFLILPYSLA